MTLSAKHLLSIRHLGTSVPQRNHNYIPLDSQPFLKARGLCRNFNIFDVKMVNLSALTSLNTCLSRICAGRSDCVAFASDTLDAFSYQLDWVNRFNLAIDVTPDAVIRPNSADEVAAAVQCAADNGYKVQAKSGGHSYANFGLGDGALTVDLVNLQRYSMNETTWYATIGAGMKLGNIDTNLTQTGRAFAHGVCPGVGIGGHATIVSFPTHQ